MLHSDPVACTGSTVWISQRGARFLVAVFVSGACLGQPQSAIAGPAPLPEWEGVKKPAPLPNWDAAVGKDKPAAKKPKAKKTAPAGQSNPAQPGPVAEPGPAAQPGPVAEPVVAPEPVPEPTPEPVPEPAAAPEPTPEPVPAEPAPVVAEAPEPGPSVQVLEQGKLARRRARAELVTGGVLLGLGLGGVAAMTVGLLQKSGADDLGAKSLARADSMIAAGAASGAMGLAMGIALLVEGARDRKAARSAEVARVRVAPTLGGLVLSGRF